MRAARDRGSAHPAEHFRLMVGLAEELRTVPAQIVKHAYHHDAFGSWCTTVRHRGLLFRIVFDGKERRARLERETAAKTDQWSELCSLPTTDQVGAQAIPDILARLRAAV
jgi:hypothetical protein